MEKELIDLVDRDNNVIGTTDVETAHRLKQWHRVVGVFIFDIEGQLYVQNNQVLGRYDNAVGGHVRSSESYDDAAQRELWEELHLNVSLKHISTFIPAQARLHHIWSLYEGVTPKEWEFKETEEVKTLERFDLQTITTLVKNNPEKFTQGLINTIHEYTRIKGAPDL